MVAFKLSISAGELGRRMRERLRGAGPVTAAQVVWQQETQRVLIYTSSLAAKFLDGWLVCNLDLQTDQTGKQTLQFVYFLGKQNEGDGLQAAGTINAVSTGAAQVAAVWGEHVQRVLWDAVLDALEACLQKAATEQPNQKLTMGGFTCTADAVQADVFVGEF